MPQRNRNIIIAVAILAVLGLAYLVNRNHLTPTVGTGTPATNENVNSSGANAPTNVNAAPTSGTSGGMTYADAIAAYQNRRIQFTNCTGSPGSMVLKQYAKIMLDNRDAKSHTIKVGASSYRLAARGWTIATVNTIGTYNITCDGGGAASLNVQK